MLFALIFRKPKDDDEQEEQGEVGDSSMRTDETATTETPNSRKNSADKYISPGEVQVLFFRSGGDAKLCEEIKPDETSENSVLNQK